MTRVLAPDLAWVGGRFRRGVGVAWSPETGRILEVGPVPGTREDAEVERLSGRALLPGFVNAHSHAFQRLIRGRTQWRAAGGGTDDFWSWREAMYEAAARLSPEDLFDVARFCFLEMLRAGFTAVGEFHYLHRDPAGKPYADPNELAGRVVAAARAVGIRIVLLDACYARGGLEEPLGPRQARFATPDLDAYREQVERLRAETASDPGVSVGVAPHSVRAVPREWLRPIAEWAAETGLPVHAHVSEQPAEVAATRERYGLGPLELLAEEGVTGPRFTAVHATHLSGREAALLGGAEATACLCPTTERDLGDGVPPASELLEAGVRFAVGSDSQTVIDPFEEMRSIEYHERLRLLRRSALVRPSGAGGPGDGRLEVAPVLLEAGTLGGARALGLRAGELEAGALADFVAVDLDHPSLAGWTDGSLAPLLALSAPAAVVTDAWVGGVRRVERGDHPLAAEAAERFSALARRGGDGA